MHRVLQLPQRTPVQQQMEFEPVDRIAESLLSELQAMMCQYANYALELMRERTGHGTAYWPLYILLEVAAELDTAVGRICEARANKIKLEYGLAEMRESLVSKPDNVTQHDHLLQFPHPFPPGPGGQLIMVDEPIMITDQDHKMVVCYLPGLFTPDRIETIWNIFKEASSMDRPVMVAGRRNWATEKALFKTEDGVIKPGVINMSPCRYPRGHADAPDDLPGPSSFFDMFNETAGQAMAKDLVQTNAIIGAIFFLLHPDAFNQQVNTHQRVYGKHCETSRPMCTRKVFQHWASPFNLVSVLCNRETPIHRNMDGGPLMLDFLTTFGRYSDGRFEVPGLGARFVYNPGTGITLPGHLFPHGASRVNGEHIGMEGFIRPEVGRFAYAPLSTSEWVEEGPPSYPWLTYLWGMDRDDLLTSALEDERGSQA